MNRIRQISEDRIRTIVSEALRRIDYENETHTGHLSESEQRISPVMARRIIAEQRRRGNLITVDEIKSGVYYPIGPQEFNLSPGNRVKSIMTLQEPPYGQVFHIFEDDHCFVTCTNKTNDDNDGLKAKECVYNTHIFPELFEELKRLSVDDLD